MKLNSVVYFLLAALLGAIGGYLFRGQFDLRSKFQGTAILRDFSFSEFITNTVSAEWEMIEDRVYDTIPPLSRSPMIGRRIVAQSMLASSEQSSFARRFEASAEKWITSHGAAIKGEYNAGLSSTNLLADGQAPLLVNFPRRFYSIDNVHGVADFGCVADSGRVTVIISILEGY